VELVKGVVTSAMKLPAGVAMLATTVRDTGGEKSYETPIGASTIPLAQSRMALGDAPKHPVVSAASSHPWSRRA
jgi:hypothetical protein